MRRTGLFQLTCNANLVLKAVTSRSLAHTSPVAHAPSGVTSAKRSAAAGKRAGAPWWKVGDELSEPSRTSPEAESSQAGAAESIEVREPEEGSRESGSATETVCKEQEDPG